MRDFWRVSLTISFWIWLVHRITIVSLNNLLYHCTFRVGKWRISLLELICLRLCLLYKLSINWYRLVIRKWTKDNFGLIHYKNISIALWSDIRIQLGRLYRSHQKNNIRLTNKLIFSFSPFVYEKKRKISYTLNEWFTGELVPSVNLFMWIFLSYDESS